MMIRTNELRIGNCIKQGVIKGIIDQRIFIDKLAIHYANVNPIEITEEILLKCGFEKFEDHNKYGWYLKVDNRYLCWCFNEYISLEFTENQAYLNYNDTLFDYTCKYLHQLQNLYFALTGEELEIKL